MPAHAFDLAIEASNLVAVCIGAIVSLFIVFRTGRRAILKRQKLGITAFWICEIVALASSVAAGRQFSSRPGDIETVWPFVENGSHALGIIALTYVIWQLVPQLRSLRNDARSLEALRDELDADLAYQEHLNGELKSIYRLLASGGADFPTQALEIAAKALDVGRLSIWIGRDDPNVLNRLVLINETSIVDKGFESFDRAAAPVYRDFVRKNQILTTSDALADHRVSEFRDGYIVPNGIKSLCYIRLEAPVVKGGAMCAETVEEHREWRFEEIAFLRSVGDAVLLEEVNREVLESDHRLRTAQAEFDAVAEFSQCWDVLVDLNGTVTWSNRAVERTTGFAIDDIVGKPDFPVILGGTESERSELAKVRACILADIPSDERPIEITTPDGGSEWLVMTWRRVDDSDGLIDGHVVSTIRVTRRQRAEQSLVKAEKSRKELGSTVQAFLENTPTAVIQTRVDGTITSWNPGARKIFGWSSEDAVGRDVDQLFLVAPSDVRVDLVDQLRSPLYKHSDVKVNRRKDGEQIVCDWKDTVIADGKGRAVSKFSIVSDITDRIQHENNLERERRRFEDFSTAASDFFWETDADGMITHMSQRFFELATDMKVDHVVGQHIEALAPAAIRERSWVGALEAISERRPFRGAALNRKMKDGRHLRVALNGVPVRDERGDFSGYRGSGTDMDQTMRQTTVSNLIALNVRGLVGSDYFSALVNSIFEYIQSDWVLIGEVSDGDDPQVHVIAGHGQNGELVPYSFPLAGSPCENPMESENVVIIPHGAAKRFPNDQSMFDKATEGYAGIRLVDGEGQLAGVLLVLSHRPLDDPSLVRSALEIFGARALAEISRKRSEAANEVLQHQLVHQQRMEIMGALAGGIAHDFNNILTPIMGYSEILSSSLEEGTRYQADADAILNGARRARVLVNQILDFSRRKETSQSVVFDIAPIIKGTAAFVQASLPAPITLTMRIDGELPFVKGDPSKFDQVLMNLITNAAQAIGDEKGEIEIVAKLESIDEDFASTVPTLNAGEHLCVSVKDSGAGIPADLVDRIFEPFFTTKGSGSGTGFGLSTSKGIVEAMNGCLQVRGEPGEGATFVVYLPIVGKARQAAEITATPSRSAFAIAARLRSKTLHILFVDDEVENSRVVARMLEKVGHIVSIHDNAVEALRAFEEDPDQFDLVITDDSMPDLTGADMVRRMIATNPDLPVIVVSGGSKSALHARYTPMGVTEFVAKPFGILEISEAIQVASQNSVNKILARF